jgi:zinc D-Ala-D-Ala carboxypeptidase
VLLVCIAILSDKALAPKPAKTSTAKQPANTATTPSFNKARYSTTGPSSMWVVVNKQHQLTPKDYVPADLVYPNIPLRVPGNASMQVRQKTAAALEELAAGAKTAGLNLMLASGYRSYSYQVGLYNGYVKSIGQTEADKTSARPGYSEHQTGLAADLEPASRLCEVTACFGDTTEGTWLAAHAYEYGFIIRYPADKVPITGYSYEPWHIRYVGKELAGELHKQHIATLEEFFGITGGQSYR